MILISSCSLYQFYRDVPRKTIEEASFMDVKVKFYKLMVQYYSHEKDAWEIAQCYYKVLSDYMHASHTTTRLSSRFITYHVKIKIKITTLFVY